MLSADMSHTIKDKAKLLARVRRIRGQVEAIDRALEDEAGCGQVMHLIAGGLAFGSIALVADGLHMSTHAGALLLAAVAYSYARRHADDPRFSFGTGKLGDLAGFTSAIVLAAIAVVIGWDAVSRFATPVPIHFKEAIPIAALGLVVNLASAWLLSGGHVHAGGHDHHAHRHADDDHHDHGAHAHHGHRHHHHAHAKATHGDNNMRAALVHVAADAAVSLMVIGGLSLAAAFGWMWMDPLAGLVGAIVIASWSYGLIRDTGAILLDMAPDRALAGTIRDTIEADGDRIVDLHVWRLGPGHLGGIISVATTDPVREPAFYRAKLRDVPSLSHLTVEVNRMTAVPS